MIQWLTDLRWTVWGYRFFRAQGQGRKAAWTAAKRLAGADSGQA